MWPSEDFWVFMQLTGEIEFQCDLHKILGYYAAYRRDWVSMWSSQDFGLLCNLQERLSSMWSSQDLDFHGTYRRAWVSMWPLSIFATYWRAWVLMWPSEDFWAFLRLTGELEFEWAWFHGWGGGRGGHRSLVLAGVLIHDQIVWVAVILRVLSTLVDKTRVTQFPFSFTEKKMINQIIIALINPG